MTLLCASIFVQDHEQAQRDIAQAAEAGAEAIELRVDRFINLPRLQSLLVDTRLPVIVTCRARWEGGQCELDEPQRLAYLRDIANLGLSSYVDVELKAVGHIALPEPRERRTGLIVSSHDFAGRPDRLMNLLAELNESPADVIKLVWTARSIRDNLEAFDLLRQKHKPTIAFCMGEAGVISRVLARKFGAFLTFAALSGNSATAPGQVSIADMRRLYRWDKIGPQTQVFGVVAHPVGHSMSPAVHNAGFDETGYDGVYLPMLVHPSYESFKAFMESFARHPDLHLRGLSVTIPHKENALRYLTEQGAEVEELARRIGAVNTIIIDRDNTDQPIFRGINTDYRAIIESICLGLDAPPEALAGKRVAVIGAGGTGRTAVAALANLGATVVVYNRTFERAEELAREFNGQTGQVVAARMDKLCGSCCQVYVNTTSVGMHPNVNDSPFGDDPPKLSADSLVFDTIYNPMTTRLLQQARDAGARTVGGIEMFVRQAAAQFTAWTNLPSPVQVMRSVLEARLRR